METKLKVEQAKTADLLPYAHNAKEHPEWQVDQIAASIEQFGFNDPVGVWTNHDGQLEIVEGHGRVLAAKALGIEKLPIIRLDHLDDEGRRAYTHVHNRATEATQSDWAVLQEEIAAMPEFDWQAMGFDWKDAPEAYDPDEIIEDMPPEEYEPRCSTGDLWQLGEHRLKCGDATSAEDIGDLLAGEKPAFVFTDPPYGVAIGTKNKAINAVEAGRGGRIQEDIEGDTLDEDALSELLVKAFKNLRGACAEDCSYYVSAPQGGSLGMVMLQTMKDAGLEVRHQLIWVKSSAVFSLGRLDYDYKHEPIFYTWTKSHNFYGGYSTTVIDDTKPLEKMTKPELKDLVRAMQEEKETSVIYCDKPMRNDLHPTMKPVKLVARFMHNSSKEGDVVADIFGGSGSTLIAAEQLGRKARLMEIDPHYCDVIIARWETFTGQTAVKI